MPSLRHTLPAFLLAAAVFAAPASAADRYASPSGAGNCSDLGQPCSIANALNGAQSGDSVHLAAGNYSVTNSLSVKDGVKLLGPTGGPDAANIDSSVGGGNCTFYTMDHNTVSDLSLNLTASAARGFCPGTTSTATTYERLQITGTSDGPIGISATTGDGLVIRDTAIYFTTANADGISVSAGATANITGVTVRLTGGNSHAVSGNSIGSATSTTIRNSVLEASAGVTQQSGSGTNTVNVDYSWVTSYLSGGGTHNVYQPGTHNLSSAPVLVGGSDLRQAPGSPSIDAGLPGIPSQGANDFEGDPRVMGSAPDIGADEFRVQPTATTNPADGIGDTGAGISGMVAPAGTNTDWMIEYGTTAAYGSHTTAKSISGTSIGAVPVSAALSGLSPGTTYHARVTATNKFGQKGSGADVTFTTTSTAATPGGQTGPAGGVVDPPAGPPITPGSQAPQLAIVLSSLHVRALAPKHGRRTLAVRFKLSGAGSVSLQLQRCRPHRACKRVAGVPARKLTVRAAGSAKATLRLPSRALPRGSYRLVAKPVSATGLKGKQRTAKVQLRR